MKPVYLSRAVLVVFLGWSTSAVFAQEVLNKTDLGKSQNTRADLANSLIVPDKPKFKGEKKEEVDPKKLTSKRSNDTTFSGSLNDIGLDWTGNKLGKPSGSQDANSTAGGLQGADSAAGNPKDLGQPTTSLGNSGGREPSVNRSSEAENASPARTSVSGKPSAGDSDSKSAKSSESAEKNSTAAKSSDASGEAQSKEQKPTTSKPEEKSPEKEKSTAAKPDGDR